MLRPGAKFLEFFFLSFGYVGLQMLLAPVRLRLFTEFFTEAQYGLINLVIMVVNALVFAISLGTFEFFVRRLPGRDEAYQQAVYGKVLRVFLPLVLGLAVLGSPLAFFFLGGAEFTLLDALAAGVALVMYAVMNFRIYFLLGRSELLRFRLCQFLAMDLWFFLVLAALPFLPAGASGGTAVTVVLWIWAGWLAVVVLFTESWASIKKAVPLGRASPESLAAILAFSVPLLPMILGELLIRITDRLFVTGYAGAAAMGEYTATMGVATIVYGVGAGVLGLIFPELNREMNTRPEGTDPASHPPLQRIVSVMLRYALVLSICGGAVLVFLGGHVLNILVGENFRDAFYILPWAAPISLFFLLHIVFSRVLIAQDRSGLVGALTLAAGLLNVVLNAILIPRHESAGLGAAIATGISLAILAAASGFAVKGWRWIDRDALRFLRIVLGCTLSVAVYALSAHYLPRLAKAPTVNSLLILGINGIASVAILLASGLFAPSDMKLLFGGKK